MPLVTTRTMDRAIRDARGLEHPRRLSLAGTGGGIDYDYVYVGGIEYEPGANPNGYDFLQIGADGSSSWIEAMISPMPTGYEIYNVKKNHIHITGATAGNI